MPQKQLASTRRFVRFNLVPQSVIDEEEEEEDGGNGFCGVDDEKENGTRQLLHLSDDESNSLTHQINEQNRRKNDDDLPEAGTSNFMSNFLDTTSNVALAFSTPSITIGNSQNNRLNASILRPAHKRLRSTNSLDNDGGFKRPLLSDLTVNTDMDNENDFLPAKNTVRFEKNHISRTASDIEDQNSPTLRNQAMSRRASLFVRRISMAIPSLSGDPLPQSVGFISVPNEIALKSKTDVKAY